MPVYKETKNAAYQEVIGLLDEGCVLTSADVSEIGYKHGFKSRRNLWYLGVDLGINPELPDLDVGEFKLYERRLLGIETPIAFLEKLLGTWIIRSADIPIEETEFERVAQDIKNRKSRKVLSTHH